MAATITTIDYETFIATKNMTSQSLITARKAMVYVAKVVFGAADTYATGGVAANLKARGAKKVDFVIFNAGALGLDLVYDNANSKILMYENTGVETVNADTQLQSKTIYALVFARQ